MLFGEEQGTKNNITVSTIDEVKVFKNTDEAEKYGEEILQKGGDSYLVYNEKESIKWIDKTWELFKAKQVESFLNETKLSIDEIAKKTKTHAEFVSIIDRARE